MPLQIFLLLFSSFHLLTTDAKQEMTISTYKLKECKGTFVTETEVEDCAPNPNRKGLYIKTTCSGTTVSKAGFKTKDCRGAPQTYEVTDTGCVDGKDGEKTSVGTECWIPEPFSTSPSRSSRLLVASVAVGISFVLMVVLHTDQY